jgi:hypothetical protein
MSLRTLCLSVVVGTFAFPACATADAHAPEPAYARKTVINFEDDGVASEMERPEGAYLENRRSMRGGGAPGSADMAMAPEEPAPDADQPEPKPEPAAEPEATPSPSTKRLVIYTAQFGVLVASVDDARQRFLAAIEKEGGYLESQDDARVTVRVPALRFQSIIDGLADYGPITHRRVDAQDVTKRAFELALRIDNAEKARTRLLALLADAREMKDILAIEVELRRLTEEIELLKGELRTLEDRVSFSTLTVVFQSNAPPPIVYGRRQSRFQWINQVGAENVQGGF